MIVKLSNNGTLNKNTVFLNDLEINFSYETPVSFKLDGKERRTRQNDWSTTTGKFLNELEPDKKKRIAGNVFEHELNEILSKS